MAYTLNTGHALYGNLIELIGVQSGALVSHKTPRTFTPESGTSFGSGTYGEHFSTVENGYSSKGVSFTPEVTLNTVTTPNYTVVAVFNGTGAATAPVAQLISRPAGGSSIKGPGKHSDGRAAGSRVSGAAMGTGPRMLTYCRIGETAAKLYNNKVKDVDTTGLANDWQDTNAGFSFIGGWNGQYSLSSDLVWLAVFNKELSSTEISDLYDSLGASNAFALVSSGDTTAPTLTSQSVTAVGVTTATGNVTTDEGNGTLYSVVSTSSTPPSAAQIQAGQNHTGASAVWSGNQSVTTTGAKTFSITGLATGTGYYAHFQHKDAANNNSSVVTSTQFTTDVLTYSLVLDTGTYSITGVDLTLGGVVTYSLALDSGVYTISAVDANFGVGFPLDAGTYTTTGSDVDLTYSVTGSTYSLVLEAGTYTLTGADVSTPVASRMVLDTGTYTLVGRSVLLQSSAQPVIIKSGMHTISVSIKIGL